MNDEEKSQFFNDMFHQSRNKIADVDAIVVLNYSKEKNVSKYIALLLSFLWFSLYRY